jgi:serralysin
MQKNLVRAAVLAAFAVLAACNSNVPDAPVMQAPQQASTAAVRATTPASQYRVLVQQLYISYFGRPADTGGLANFTARLAELHGPTDIQGLASAYGGSAALRALVDAFGISAESAALYSGDNTAFVTAIYDNVLGRAPDAAGRAYWVGEIDAGRLTRANASLSIMAGALSNTSAQGLLDAELVNRRVSVGTNFTTALDTPQEQAAYSGDAAAAAARVMLANVHADTDVAGYQTTVNAIIAAIVANAKP